MNSTRNSLLHSRGVSSYRYLSFLCWVVAIAVAAAGAAKDSPFQQRRRWGYSLTSRCCLVRDFDVPTSSFLLQQQLRGGGSSDYESDVGSDKVADDDELLPVIEEEEEVEGTEEDDDWFDAESSLAEKEADMRGGDDDYEEDVVHALTEADEDEAITEAWEDEEEEEDFADQEDIPMEMAAPVEDFNTQQEEVVMVEPATERLENTSPQQEQQAASSFTTDAVLLEDPAIDDNDSSTYVDRMDLADAYDEDFVGLDTTDAHTDGGDTTASTVFATTESTNANRTAATADVVVESVTAAAADSSSVTTMSIDDDTRKVLIQDLKYRKSEVDAMKPDIAAVVAAKKLYRPPEGMPANWHMNTNGTTTTRSQRDQIIQILPKIILPAIVGAIAITKGPDFVAAMTASSSKRSWARAAAKHNIPAAVGAIPMESSSSSLVSSTAATTQQPLLVGEPFVPQNNGQQPLLPVNEHTSALGEIHPHSVKPGKHPLPVDESDLDVTWLDKLITAVGRKIQAFLRLEI
jgi:hypothetical protein